MIAVFLAVGRADIGLAGLQGPVRHRDQERAMGVLDVDAQPHATTRGVPFRISFQHRHL